MSFYLMRKSILKRYWSSRERYDLQQSSFLNDNKTVLFYSLIVFVVVLLARSWANFTHPGLYVEDTSHYFNYFYGDFRGLEGLLNSPNGYYNIFTNGVGLLVAKLDVRIQPTIYLFVSVSMTVVTVMALSCSGLIRNKYLLFICPLLLGLSGANHLYYYITLTYLIYVLVILLFCLLFWEAGNSIWKSILLFLFLSLLVWSGPYSVLVIPFALLFVFLFRGKTTMLIGLVIVAFCYLLSVTEKTIMLMNIFDPMILEVWSETLLLKVFLMESREHITPKILVILGSFFVLTISIFRKDYFYLKVALLLFALINGPLALLFLSKKYLLYQRVAPCHLFLPQFFWLFFLLFTADRFLSKSRSLKHLGLVFSFCFVAFVVYDNKQNLDQWTAPVMTTMERYLDTVHEHEQYHWENENKVKVITTPGKRTLRPTVWVGKHSDESAEIESIHVE